jgi:hypothetical protein
MIRQFFVKIFNIKFNSNCIIRLQVDSWVRWKMITSTLVKFWFRLR